MMTANALRYKPFTQRDEIRLIVLHSGHFFSPIRCSLVHVRLDANPHYDALSYVWGSEQDTDIVYVNRSSHLVGKNLFLALQHLRLESETRFLWIDALCINQLDDGERGHQVAQMGVIYSHAAVVRIWLGLPDQSTEATFLTIAHIYHGEQLSLQFDRDTRSQFISLCSRPYWTRLWVIQEVVLASKLEIHCGSLKFPWETLAAVFIENPAAFDEIRDSSLTKLCRQRLAAGSKAYAQRTRLSLLFLMEIHSQARCADVRDKIYGLHSFAPWCCREAIPVDYSCSAYELCARLLKHEVLNHMPRKESFMRISHRLHQMMVHGAIEQETSRMAFPVGSCGAGVSNSPDEIGTQVSVEQLGTVAWISPPLSKIWDDGQNLELPDDLISIIGLERTLENYPVDRILQNHGDRKAPLNLPRRQTLSKDESLLHTVSLPKYDRGVENIGSLDSIFTTIRNFLLYVQRLIASEECCLVMGKTRHGGYCLLHTQADVKVDDMIFGFPSTDVLALTKADSTEIIGRAVSFQPETLPSFTSGPFWHLTLDFSTIIALSRVLV